MAASITCPRLIRWVPVPSERALFRSFNVSHEASNYILLYYQKEFLFVLRQLLELGVISACYTALIGIDHLHRIAKVK